MKGAIGKAASLTAGFLVLLGGLYSYGILQVRGREFTTGEIGPTAYPWLLVVLLVVLAALLLAGEWSVLLRGGGEMGQVAGEGGAARWRLPVAALLIFLYIGTLESVGFLWDTPLFLGLFLPLYGIRRLPLIVAVAVGFTVALYSLLWHLFGILLP